MENNRRNQAYGEILQESTYVSSMWVAVTVTRNQETDFANV